MGLLESLQTAIARPVLRAPPVLRRWVAARGLPPIGEHPLDPEAQYVLWVIRHGSRPMHELGLRGARRVFDRMPHFFDDPPSAAVHREVTLLPGPAGALEAWVYRPRTRTPRPVLVYLHGGGGVLGSPRSHDRTCRFLAEHAECVVVSVDYRLAPEHPYPAAVLDADAAFAWVARRAARWGGDPKRIAIGGDSMGGNIASVVAQRRRDHASARPRAQLLLYPPTDAAQEMPSRHELGDGFMLTADLIDWFHRLYIGTADPCDPGLSPLRADDVRGLCPAIVVTAGYDPLRDEGDAYAIKLRDAGVPTVHLRYPALIHGFVQMPGVIAEARAAMSEIASALRDALA